MDATSFTDDDLRRLKDDLMCVHPDKRIYIALPDRISKHDVIALLTRLEAAEQFGNAVMQDDPSYGDMPEWRAWRKAAGK